MPVLNTYSASGAIDPYRPPIWVPPEALDSALLVLKGIDRLKPLDVLNLAWMIGKEFNLETQQALSAIHCARSTLEIPMWLK